MMTSDDSPAFLPEGAPPGPAGPGVATPGGEPPVPGKDYFSLLLDELLEELPPGPDRQGVITVRSRLAAERFEQMRRAGATVPESLEAACGLMSADLRSPSEALREFLGQRMPAFHAPDEQWRDLAREAVTHGLISVEGRIAPQHADSLQRLIAQRTQS
jgi:hypothetical protein